MKVTGPVWKYCEDTSLSSDRMLAPVTVGSSARVKPSQGCHLLFSFQTVSAHWSNFFWHPVLMIPGAGEEQPYGLQWLEFQHRIEKGINLYSLRKTMEATRQYKTNERASWDGSGQEVCLEDSPLQLPLEKPQWVGSRWLSSANTPKSPKTPDYWGNEVLAS